MNNLETCRINVMVTSMDTAIDFYTNILGLDLLNRYGDNYAEVQAPDLLIGLHPAGKELVKGNNMSIGLGVVKFDDTVTELEQKGVAIKIADEGWIRLAHFQDPDGNQLFLAERESP